MDGLRDNLRTLCATLAIAASIGLLAACGGDSAVATGTPAGATTPAPAPTDPPAPAPTDAPVTTAAPADPGTTPAEADDGDSSNALTIVLIIAGVGLVLIVIVALLSGSKSKQPARRPAAAPPLPASPQANLLSTSQWVNDQLSLELMSAPPAASLARWSVERSRLDNVAIGAEQQFLQDGNANWRTLGQTVSALASSLDTNLQLRAQDPPNAQLINESTEVVSQQRANLRQLIAVLRPMVN